MTPAFIRFVGALAGLVIISACGPASSDTSQKSPSPSAYASAAATPTPSTSPSALSRSGFVFRTWDGTAYGLELENAAA
ncbi:MAG TPA: hypothetical protein VHJ99_07245, partial [Candidatus Dormibacteraeota bacterium]|nr:hypothetical protein [Candidatus Dormibacteraeota bacterium]